MNDGPGDAELLASGTPEAFGELFDRHARAVYNHCFRLVADWSAAEDLTSIVFLIAWRRRHTVVLDGESVRPWLLGVATNAGRNETRTRRRYRAALDRLPSPPAEPDPADDVAGRVDDERRMRELRGSLAELTPAQQDVVTLCLWSGLTYEQAAVALDVPVGTVRSRLARARARLRHLADPGARRTPPRARRAVIAPGRPGGSTMTLPESRDLPAGHHEARRAHLLREIALPPHAGRTSRRLLTGAGVVLLAGSGVGAAAAAGAFHGASTGSTTTVACFGRAAIDHSSMAVIHPQ